MDMEKVALNDEVLSSIQGGTQLPYEIKSGDTLGELAKKYHCTVEQLCQWNTYDESPAHPSQQCRSF